jgi:glutathione S-transferase
MTWNANYQAEREQLREKAADRLGKLDKYFARVRVSPHHLVSSAGFTIADLYAAFLLELALPFHPGLLANYPSLDAFMRNVFLSPGPVHDYVFSERRPKTHTIPLAHIGGKPSETHQWC